MATNPVDNGALARLRFDDVEYSGGANIKRFLFVCGLHRSGTTLVEDYIRSNFKVSCLRARVPENEGQFLQNVYPKGFEYGGPGRFAFAKEMNPAPVGKQEGERIRRVLTESWRPFVVGTDETLLEKSPPNITKIDWLRSVFPGATFLVVARDPRAVSAATQKWSNTTLDELMLHWHTAYSIAIAELRDDCHLLKYEDFCIDPAKALEACGLSARLERRAQPLDAQDRFRDLRNTNDEYLELRHLELHRWKRYGQGAWSYFGYDLG